MKLAFSQNLTSTVSAAFNPATHPNIRAFYKFKSLGGADIAQVSSWNDQTGNFNLLQATVSEQPSYSASTGAVNFSGGNDSLESATSFGLSSSFVVAIRMNVDTTINNDVAIGSNKENGNFIRIKSSNKITLRYGNGAVTDHTLNSGTTISDSTTFNLIVSRNDDGLTKIFFDGTEQTTTKTESTVNEFVIDALGVRRIDTNDLDGAIFEVQVYDGISFDTAGFITKINNHLDDL